MKALLQSSFVIATMLVVLLLTIINTCQINNLEEQLLATRQALGLAAGAAGAASGGVGVAGTGVASGASRRARLDPGRLDPDEQAALADPENLLRPSPRGFVIAREVAAGGTLRLQIGQDPGGLNPYIANGADVVEYNAYVGNVLAARQKDNPDLWQPELAIKVTTDDDGLSYTVQLRRGVMWHRPTVDWESGRYDWLRGEHELTADDVAFVFEMLRNPQVAGRVSAMRNYFEAFDRFEALGRYQFRVVFKERLFTNLPSLLDLSPMPRWLYRVDEDGQPFDDATWGLKLNEHWYNRSAIGTGPYRFVIWEPGVKIELERSPDYWGEPPAFDRVQLLVVKDQDAWPRKLKTGEIDLTQLQPEQYRTAVLEAEAEGPLLGNRHIKMNREPTLGYFYLGWNADTPYFSDRRVRQAMTLALDRKRIIEHVFHGLGELITGPFALQSPCYDKTIEPWPYDLAQAARKLDEAGWQDSDGDGIRDRVVNGERMSFEFTLLIYGASTEYETLANIYRESLLQIGVRMNPRAVDWARMLLMMYDKEFDGYTGGWVLGWEVDLTQTWHSSEADRPKSSNRIGFRNARADDIAVRLRREFDPAKRVALCHEFHRLLHEEQPYTFIYQRERPVLYWDYLNDPEYALMWPHRDLRYWSFRRERP